MAGLKAVRPADEKIVVQGFLNLITLLLMHFEYIFSFDKVSDQSSFIASFAA